MERTQTGETLRNPKAGEWLREWLADKEAMKGKTLLSMYILQCGEELQDPTPKFNLFVRFRKDQDLQRIVDNAKSLLSADKSFFSLDCPNVRVEGAEAHGKAAKMFAPLIRDIINLGLDRCSLGGRFWLVIKLSKLGIV